jgi:hypothetical protein
MHNPRLREVFDLLSDAINSQPPKAVIFLPHQVAILRYYLSLLETVAVEAHEQEPTPLAASKWFDFIQADEKPEVQPPPTLTQFVADDPVPLISLAPADLLTLFSLLQRQPVKTIPEPERGFASVFPLPSQLQRVRGEETAQRIVGETEVYDADIQIRVGDISHWSDVQLFDWLEKLGFSWDDEEWRNPLDERYTPVADRAALIRWNKNAAAIIEDQQAKGKTA